MAWSSADQNPSLAPAPGLSSPNYAASLQQAAYYNPLGGGSASTGMAPSVAPTGETNYAERLGATAAAPPPAKAQSTRRALEWSSGEQPANASRAAREIQPWGGGGSRFEIAGKAAAPGRVDKVNDALVDIMQKAAEGSDYNVQLFSGYRPGDRRQHGRGNAVDIALVDPYSGEALPNYQSAKTFPQYETFARKAYEIAQRDYPDLAEGFRWGGYFGGGKGKYGAVDAMHFDVNSGMGMAGGSFERGLTADQQRRVDQMGTGRTQWAGLRPGVTAAPPTMYAGDPFGVSGENGRTVMAGGTAVPTPRQRPQRTETAYAPSPETMDAAPFDAVLAASRDRRPQPPAPPANPRRDRLQAPAAPQPQPAPQGGEYVVRQGDNLSRIARQFGTSVEAIAAANGIRDPNVIQVGRQLVIPGGGAPAAAAPAARQPANVPQPRMRPSREVAMPQPRPRPDVGFEASPGGAPDAATVPSPPPRPAAPAVDPSRYELTGVTPRERVEQRRRGGPVAPMSEMDYSMGRVLNARQNERIARGMTLPWNPAGGTPETQMSIDRPQRSPPAGPGMDTSGLIRAPTPEEQALQAGARLPLPTGAQPIDPVVAAQIRRTPVVIVDPRSPPIFTSRSGVRIWAAR